MTTEQIIAIFLSIVVIIQLIMFLIIATQIDTLSQKIYYTETQACNNQNAKLINDQNQLLTCKNIYNQTIHAKRTG